MPVPDQVRDDVSGIPARRPAGRQKILKTLDSGLRRNDGSRGFQIFYEFIFLKKVV